jgi:hypothetical protein
MNLVQGAAEADAIESGHLPAAIEWMRSREVDRLVPSLPTAPLRIALRPGWHGAAMSATPRSVASCTLGRSPTAVDPGPLEIHELGPPTPKA